MLCRCVRSVRQDGGSEAEEPCSEGVAGHWGLGHRLGALPAHHQESADHDHLQQERRQVPQVGEFVDVALTPSLPKPVKFPG